MPENKRNMTPATLQRRPSLTGVSPRLSRLKHTGALVGQTPLHRFFSLSPAPGVAIYAKLEWQQLGGSVKARAAYAMIRAALTEGVWSAGQRLLDASSGNTGIAYGAVAAALGLPVTLCLPANASAERKRILKALGVELILTDPLSGTDGAQEVARALWQEKPGQYFYADQYNNPHNWQAHVHTTSREIFRQTGGAITHFICGLGTTGSFVGNTRGLRLLKPDLPAIALQPDGPMHGLEGWKDLETARIPGIYDASLATDQWPVEGEAAMDMLRFVARHEGLLLSPSAAANLAGAVRLAATMKQGCIVTLLPDNADKYPEVWSHLN